MKKYRYTLLSGHNDTNNFSSFLDKCFHSFLVFILNSSFYKCIHVRLVTEFDFNIFLSQACCPQVCFGFGN